MIDPKKLLKELKAIKVSLQIYTVLSLGYLVLIIFYSPFILLFTISIVRMIHLIYIGFILWYIWSRYPIEKKEKWDNTWKIIFLGIIGLWLWFPNNEEKQKLIKTLHTT